MSIFSQELNQMDDPSIYDHVEISKQSVFVNVIISYHLGDRTWFEMQRWNRAPWSQGKTWKKLCWSHQTDSMFKTIWLAWHC